MLRRRAPQKEASTLQALASLPAVFAGGIAIACAPNASQWPWLAHVAFLGGALLAVTALLQLGGCFSVLPALRGLVTSGPYRWLRHPAYAGEGLMIAACCAAQNTMATWLLLTAAVATIIARIRIEERVLAADRGFARYTQAVRWRLLPGIY